MPRPHAQPRQRRSELNDARMLQLFTGHAWFLGSYGDPPKFDEDLARRHWFEFREWIIAEYQEWNRDQKRRDSPVPWAQTYFEGSGE